MSRGLNGVVGARYSFSLSLRAMMVGNSGGGEAASLTEPATGGAVDAVTGVAKDSQTNPIA